MRTGNFVFLLACLGLRQAVVTSQLHAQACTPLPLGREVIDGGTLVPPTSSVVVGPDGRAYTAHPLNGLVRAFDPRGELEREFTATAETWSGRASRLGWLADTLYAIDFNRSTLALFDAELRLLGTRDIVPPSFEPPYRGRPPILLLDDGRGVFVPSRIVGPRMAAPESDSEGGPRPVVIAPLAGGAADTLIRLPRGNTRMSYSPGPGRTNFTTQPFHDEPILSTAADRRSFIVVDRWAGSGGSGPTYDIHRIGLDGDTLGVVRIPYDPIPLRAEWVDAAVDRIVSRHSQGIGGVEADADRIAQSVRSVLYTPDSLTPVTAVVVARDGRIWLRRESVPDADRIRWDVLDADGVRIGCLYVPSALAIRAVAGDAVWTTERVAEREYRLRVLHVELQP